jgi:hypothetical protein
MRRNRESNRSRQQGGATMAGPPPEGCELPPQALHHVFAESAAELRPGDILVLDDADTLRLRTQSDFFAVIACPRCGALDLISAAQYFGVTPVICGSNTCPCGFRIVDESRLVYMPVN